MFRNYTFAVVFFVQLKGFTLKAFLCLSKPLFKMPFIFRFITNKNSLRWKTMLNTGPYITVVFSSGSWSLYLLSHLHSFVSGPWSQSISNHEKHFALLLYLFQSSLFPKKSYWQDPLQYIPWINFPCYSTTYLLFI